MSASSYLRPPVRGVSKTGAASTLLAFFGLMLFWACSAPPVSPTPPKNGDSRTVSEIKEFPRVTGVIEELRKQKGDRIVICLRLPSGLAPNGQKEPEDPVMMPFWLDSGVNGLEELKERDAVTFDLKVDWDSPQPALITVIKKLDDPPDSLPKCQ